MLAVDAAFGGRAPVAVVVIVVAAAVAAEFAACAQKPASTMTMTTLAPDFVVECPEDRLLAGCLHSQLHHGHHWGCRSGCLVSVCLSGSWGMGMADGYHAGLGPAAGHRLAVQALAGTVNHSAAGGYCLHCPAAGQDSRSSLCPVSPPPSGSVIAAGLLPGQRAYLALQRGHTPACCGCLACSLVSLGQNTDQWLAVDCEVQCLLLVDLMRAMPVRVIGKEHQGKYDR